jgi:hypothetical protein
VSGLDMLFLHRLSLRTTRPESLAVVEAARHLPSGLLWVSEAINRQGHDIVGVRRGGGVDRLPLLLPTGWLTEPPQTRTFQVKDSRV